MAARTVASGELVKAHLHLAVFPTGSRAVSHLSNQRCFIYFCMTPERYHARSLWERFPDGKPLARHAVDQSALVHPDSPLAPILPSLSSSSCKTTNNNNRYRVSSEKSVTHLHDANGFPSEYHLV